MAVFTGVLGQAVVTALVQEAPIEGGEAQQLRMAALFDAHHEKLYRLARRMAGSMDEARDLVQETYLHAARAIGRVPVGESSEAAWLSRVLINICRDGWRKRRGRQQHDHVIHAENGTAHPEPALIARATIWRALQCLPPRRRAAIVMYELEGVSMASIAQALGISTVTVRWHLSRGRKELARAIGGMGDGVTW